jgi:hypothetical protein
MYNIMSYIYIYISIHTHYTGIYIYKYYIYYMYYNIYIYTRNIFDNQYFMIRQTSSPTSLCCGPQFTPHADQAPVVQPQEGPIMNLPGLAGAEGLNQDNLGEVLGEVLLKKMG